MFNNMFCNSFVVNLFMNDNYHLVLISFSNPVILTISLFNMVSLTCSNVVIEYNSHPMS